MNNKHNEDGYRGIALYKAKYREWINLQYSLAINKIDRLESYLSEGLPRYQDVLEKQNRTMPEAPEGIEYKNPGIMESQIFTVLTKRFKSR